MKLIIAEKPSLGRNIAAAIELAANEKMKKGNGFLTGREYIVTWAFGHLFSLADVEAYSDVPTHGWSLANLPCFPTQFRFGLRKNGKEPDEGVKRQFLTIRALCNRDDVDEIINAGDADREGEIIVRLCVMNALKTDKLQTRLWLPDQTPETIAKALTERKRETEYDNLANEGLARTYIDWLYGVNLTRFVTLKAGGKTLYRVGRVIVPIVKAIYDRDMEIRNFKPERYYGVAGKCEIDGATVEVQSKQRFNADEADKAQAYADELNACETTVVSCKRKKETIPPGKLYSLSKLQSYLGKKYKMSMEKSLSVVQKLYEAGYVTYPRTNSEYLATAEKDKISKIIENVKKLGYRVKFKDGKTIFDDAKIESHSALTPTYKIPPVDRLSEDEKNVYSAIFRRFVAVFCEENCVAEKTEIGLKCGKETFSVKGTVLVTPGWMKYDDAGQKDKILPNLTEGTAVPMVYAPAEKETTPPKHYTIETLNNYLKNPFKEEKAAAKDSDDDDYRAIFEGLELGTEATRSGIIENAKQSGYIALTKDVYTILPAGEKLIGETERLHVSMDKYKTSELGKALKKVYRGEITVWDSVTLAQQEIAGIFASN